MAEAHHATAVHHDGEPGPSEVDRRDFLMLATGAVGAIGAALAAWPFIHQMNPAADTLALATTELDLAPIEVGQRITIKWRGNPVYISHRTKAEIEKARDVKLSDLPDPQADDKRATNPEWLVVVGVCTHLGCAPAGQRLGDERGDYGGWYCPCHGSHYDTSGRIRKGPAPKNLEVPFYEFAQNNILRIGKEG
jgi:ubiquinol-cytochrome c reductase iron-sulfur subunit